MKKIFLLLVFIISCSIVIAQPTFSVLGLVKTNNFAMTSDKLGNIYSCGYFRGVTDFDPDTSSYTLTGNVSQPSGYLMKTDSIGNFLWAKEFSGSGIASSQITQINVDSKNNLYIAGFFFDTIDFDPGSGVFPMTSLGGASVFVVKLDSFGNFIWAKKMTTGGSCYPDDILVSSSGKVYVFGRYSSTVDFDPGVGAFNMTSNGNDDIFITKLDSSGSFIWAKTIGAANNDIVMSAKLDKSENIYYVGPFSGTLDFNPGIQTFNLSGSGAETLYISKLDSSGAFVWARCAGGGTGSSSRPNDIMLDSLSNIYLTGYFGGTTDFDFSAGTYNLTSAGMVDGFVLKMDTLANLIWVSRFGGLNNDGGNKLQLDKIGNVYLNANFSGNSSFAFIGSFFYINQLSTSFGDQIFIKLDNTGHFVWDKQMSGSSQRNIYDIYVTNGNDVLISGTFSTGVVNLDSCAGSVNGTSNITSYILKIIQTYIPPPLPIDVTPANSKNICIGSSDSLIVSSLSTVNWYSTSTTTIVIGYGNSLTIPVLSSGTYTYYADASGCVLSNMRVAITVTVDPNCADVWPGDANSDGTADNLDVLELGLHYTQTGAPRASVSNTWQSYFANNWTGTITNGKNLNHSDCNGDGTIDDNDTLAIYNNYGLTHAFKPEQVAVINPQLSIVPDQAYVTKGNWGTASVYLGDATNQISNINGLAFTVDFDNTLIETNSIHIEYLNSFIDAGQNLHFRKLDFTNGKIYTATTHTVNNNVSGNGLIAKLHYQIKSSLTTDEVLTIGLSQANQSNASGTIVPLTSGTNTLMANGASVGLQELNGNNILVSPNPTNGLLTIKSKTELQKIEVISVDGKVLLSEVPTNISHTLHLDNFANGIYFVNLYQNNRVVKREKVVLNK